ncbi:hypothetical protein [Paenibacillus sp. PAMC21692]|uniref:hypothetical protein n=1 Tax=Paenibacillus sp. PAMC21692 TaxID=2762320 RepID=UPI00164D1BCB|nr:hypothetical protein [Paenibacillus sp. PAMC21692]QNK57308.1 hypothetical protein H7F31_33365 [Paenibacillus sp. PAMC21692]
MLSIIVLLCAAAVLALIEVPRLLKRKWVKEAWAFGVFLLAGLVLGVLVILHVPLPNPIVLQRELYSPVSQAIDNLLGLK